MSTPDEGMAYAAVCPDCGGFGGATCEYPGGEKEVAKGVADWISRGYAVSHVTVEEARVGLLKCGAACCEKRLQAVAERAATQPSMFQEASV